MGDIHFSFEDSSCDMPGNWKVEFSDEMEREKLLIQTVRTIYYGVSKGFNKLLLLIVLYSYLGHCSLLPL